MCDSMSCAENNLSPISIDSTSTISAFSTDYSSFEQTQSPFSSNYNNYEPREPPIPLIQPRYNNCDYINDDKKLIKELKLSVYETTIGREYWVDVGDFTSLPQYCSQQLPAYDVTRNQLLWKCINEITSSNEEEMDETMTMPLINEELKNKSKRNYNTNDDDESPSRKKRKLQTECNTIDVITENDERANDERKSTEDNNEKEEGEYEVKSIMGKIVTDNGQKYYLTEWKKFDLSDASWEPENNLRKAMYSIDKFNEKNKKNKNVICNDHEHDGYAIVPCWHHGTKSRNNCTGLTDLRSHGIDYNYPLF